MNTRVRGQEGERDAERFLSQRGAQVLERNYRCKYGEIDLIVRFEDVLVFVEVKQRTTTRYGTPAQAVDRRKQGHICRAAVDYIHARHLTEARMRFDVVEVTPSGMRHIPSAFDFIER